MTFQFASLSEFLWMSGHGPYVWACYAITLLMLVFLVLHIGRKQKRVRQIIANTVARENQRATSGEPSCIQ